LIEGVSFKVAGADATHSLLPSSLSVSVGQWVMTLSSLQDWCCGCCCQVRGQPRETSIPMS